MPISHGICRQCKVVGEKELKHFRSSNKYSVSLTSQGIFRLVELSRVLTKLSNHQDIHPAFMLVLYSVQEVVPKEFPILAQPPVFNDQIQCATERDFPVSAKTEIRHIKGCRTRNQNQNYCRISQFWPNHPVSAEKKSLLKGLDELSILVSSDLPHLLWVLRFDFRRHQFDRIIKILPTMAHTVTKVVPNSEGSLAEADETGMAEAIETDADMAQE